MRIPRSTLGDLNAFVSISKAGGFRRAALDLDVSPSALSHAMRGLEARLGVRLINRHARSVTLTQAGEELLTRLQAGFDEIARGLEALNRFRAAPAGRLRLNILSDAARLVTGKVVAAYSAAYPAVELEVTVQDAVVDIVSEGFDAGIRFGGSVPEDMVALPIGGSLRWVTVASSGYLGRHGTPVEPRDLTRHRCIGLRMGTGALYQWELERGSDIRRVDLAWSVVVSETALALDIALADGGIAYCLRARVELLLAEGRLIEVLPDWASDGEAFHLYYSSRRQMPEALRALVVMLRQEHASSPDAG